MGDAGSVSVQAKALSFDSSRLFANTWRTGRCRKHISSVSLANSTIGTNTGNQKSLHRANGKYIHIGALISNSRG